MGNKAERDARLLEMQANLKVYAAKKRAALTKEAAWLKKVRTALAGSVRTSSAARRRLGVVDEINQLLQ